MRKKLRRWELLDFIFISALGVLGHFIYDWSGKSSLVGAVSAVNESVWEHMKLLFFPAFVFAMVEVLVFAEALRNYFAAKAGALLTGLLSIPLLYYGLNGAFGRTPDYVNIAIFFLAAALTALLSYFLLSWGVLRSGGMQLLGFLFFWLLALCFILFTYRPPSLPIFLDPTTGLPGIPRP